MKRKKKLNFLQIKKYPHIFTSVSQKELVILNEVKYISIDIFEKRNIPNNEKNMVKSDLVTVLI